MSFLFGGSVLHITRYIPKKVGQPGSRYTLSSLDPSKALTLKSHPGLPRYPQQKRSTQKQWEHRQWVCVCFLWSLGGPNKPYNLTSRPESHNGRKPRAPRSLKGETMSFVDVIRVWGSSSLGFREFRFRVHREGSLTESLEALNPGNMG